MGGETVSDIEFLEAQVRSLEAENRRLGETLRDRFAMAALPACIEGSAQIAEIADAAYDIADEMMLARRME